MKPDAPSPVLHGKAAYSTDEAYAALCVMEWLLDQRRADEPPIVELFRAYGFGGMRSIALQAGVIVDAAWHYGDKRHGEFFSDWAFDWDFTPAVCRVIDWDALCRNNQYGDGKLRAPPKAVVASIIGRQAMRRKEKALS